MTPAYAATALALQRPPPHPSARTAEASFQAPHIDQVHSRFVAPPPLLGILPSLLLPFGLVANILPVCVCVRFLFRASPRCRLALVLAPALPRSASWLRNLWAAAIGSLSLQHPRTYPKFILTRPAHRSSVTSPPPESYSHPSAPLALLYPRPLRGTRRATSPSALHVLPFPADLDLVEGRLYPAASSTTPSQSAPSRVPQPHGHLRLSLSPPATRFSSVTTTITLVSSPCPQLLPTMNTGFPQRNTRALDNTDQPASSRRTPTTPPDIANRPQHQLPPTPQPLYAQQQPSASQPHQYTTPHTASMYSASYHSRAPGQPHNSQLAHHHHMYQTHQSSQQDQQDQQDQHGAQQHLQQQLQQHPQQHQHQPLKQQLQQHQQQQHQNQQQHYQQTAQHAQYPLQRGAGQAFSVPRTVSTPSWMSGAHSATYPASSNISPPTSATAPLSSSSSSASLLSYWDQSVASDSELAMASAISPTDAHYTLSDSSHHRYASSASLPALSPTGVVSHPSSLNPAATPAQMYYGVGSAEHFHPYRPASVQPMVGGSAMQSYHPAMVSVSHSGVVYPGSVSAQHVSGGLVYGASSSSLPLASGSSYDAYSPSFSTHSGYVSYLAPQSAHDSRFYALNPFEIKHRRRTTKTQFRVLESTFREVPKPNATLRKQISAQLDMPVRAVQIWFQNRRAKAKALEKKRNRDGGTDAGNDRSRAGDVGASHAGMDAERRTQEVSYGVGVEQHDRTHAGGHVDAQRESRSVDLPPLRLHADVQRQTAYAPLSPRLTLPAIHVDSTRDRRLASPPPASPDPDVAASHTLHEHPELPRHGVAASAVEASLRNSRLNAPALPSVSSARQPTHDASRYWATQQ